MKIPQGPPARPRRGGSHILALAAALLLAAASAAHAQRAPAQDDATLLGMAREGMNELMNGNPDGALHGFQQLQSQDPDSPLGDLLAADATWWKIYLSTGNLVDPDVFDVVSKTASPYDEAFQSEVQQAIRKAALRAEAHEGEARNLLYEGMAYGLLARFYGLRDNDLPTARAGKKMRGLLLQAVKLDPSLTDCNLGIGTYNYFVATLPEIVRMLKFLIGLPGGSRALGLQQLDLTAQQGDLTRAEATFYLAKDYSRANEREYGKSLALFQELATEYPDNLLWKLLVGSLQNRLGHTEQGAALYNEVVERSAAANSTEGRAMRRQAQQALARMNLNPH